MNRTAMQLIVAAIEDKLFDQVARIGVLEGIAGVQPRIWSSGSLPNFKTAQAVLGLSPMDPWITGKGSNLYVAMKRTANGLLRDTDAAEEVLQNIFAGMTLRKNPGGELYAVGQYIASKFKAGVDAGDAAPALDFAAKLLVNHTKLIARGATRSMLTEDRHFGQNTVQDGISIGDADMVQQVPSTTMLTGDTDDMIDQLMGSQGGNQIMGWLMKLWESKLQPAKFRLVKFRIDNFEDDYSTLAKMLGAVERQEVKTTGARIGLAMREAQQVAIEAVRNNQMPPNVVDLLQSARLQGEMGYHGLTASRRSATNTMLRILSRLK